VLLSPFVGILLLASSFATFDLASEAILETFSAALSTAVKSWVAYLRASCWIASALEPASFMMLSACCLARFNVVLSDTSFSWSSIACAMMPSASVFASASMRSASLWALATTPSNSAFALDRRSSACLAFSLALRSSRGRLLRIFSINSVTAALSKP